MQSTLQSELKISKSLLFLFTNNMFTILVLNLQSGQRDKLRKKSLYTSCQSVVSSLFQTIFVMFLRSVVFAKSGAA